MITMSDPLFGGITSMHNMIDKFKLGFMALLTLVLFPITLLGYIISFLSKRRPCMTLAYWKRIFNIG
jgi:hypothetical protein